MKKLLYLLLSLASFTGLRAQQLVGYLAYQQVSAPGAPSAGVTTYADTSNAFHFVAPSGSFPALVLGTPGYTDTGMFIAQLTVPSAAQGNTYAQFSIQGQNSGNAASTDFVATADNGTSSAHYVDLGINSSTNSTGVFPAGANLAFLESASDALYVGTVAPFTNTDPVTGATGLCTPLPAGQTLTLNGDRFVGIPIRAIMATGTTTLNIQTSAFDTSATLFPTN